MSLAVHGAGAVAPVFNATFYATAAAVIPVLFLALAVQGRGFGEMLRAATTAPEEAAANKRRDPVLLFPPRVLLSAALVIMAAGFVGEATAMWDLYFGSGSGLDGITVLAATLVLLLAVVTGPVLAFNMILAGRTAERIRRRRDAAAPEPETPPAASWGGK